MIGTTPASDLLLADHPLPSDCCRPIVVVSIASLSSHCVVIVVNIIVVVIIVVAAIDIHATVVVVAIFATILVVGIAAVAVAVLTIIINIVALSLLCMSYFLVVNPRNSTKASQSSIAHGMLMEQLPLDWL